MPQLTMQRIRDVLMQLQRKHITCNELIPKGIY